MRQGLSFNKLLIVKNFELNSQKFIRRADLFNYCDVAKSVIFDIEAIY